MCPGSSQYVSVDNKQCTAAMLTENACYPMAWYKEQDVPVIDGRIMCVQRAPKEINLFTMQVANSSLPSLCTEDYKSCNFGSGVN